MWQAVSVIASPKQVCHGQPEVHVVGSASLSKVKHCQGHVHYTSEKSTT